MSDRRLLHLPPLAVEIAFRLLLACVTLSSLTWLSGCFGGGLNLGNINLSGPVVSPGLVLAVSSTTVAPGAPVTMVANPYPLTTSCTATFYDGTTVLGTAPAGSSAGGLTTTFSSAGIHSLSAKCGGYTTSTVSLTVTAQTVAPFAPSTVNTIYAAPYLAAGNAVFAFSPAIQGSVSPTTQLGLPTGFLTGAVATDNLGQLYVGGYTGNVSEVLIASFGNSGSVTQLRTLTGSAATFTYVTGLCVDASGLLYVASINLSYTWTVSVFAAGASGAATPIRTLTGTLPTLTSEQPGSISVALDGNGNLYVSGLGSNNTQIGVFPSTASGAATPTRLITAPSGSSFRGLAVDAAGDIYTAEEDDMIVKFAAGASGVATPVSTIAGASTQLDTTGGGVQALAIDSAGNLYVSNTDPASYAILIFGPTAQGNVAPSAYIISSSLSYSFQIAVH